MYATCLVCADPLGTNDVLATLPVGRRVAFDPAKGRLWVICPSCARWNLVPFDTRLETIDACERFYRDTRTRFSTGTIGMARLPTGLELVRIGPALRPEFAAWRYGRQMLRRRRRPLPGSPEGAGFANWVTRVATTVGALLAIPFLDEAILPRHAIRRARLVRDPGTGHLLRVHDMAMVGSTLRRDESGWRLEIPYRSGIESLLGEHPLILSSIRDYPAVGFFRDEELLPGLGRVLPSLERRAPGPLAVAEATRLLERTLDAPESLLAYVAGAPLRYQTQGEFPLSEVPGEIRLALEMAAHEESELKLLEREWREAEQFATIMDDLAISAEVQSGFLTLKRDDHPVH
jgi:hypothetical protein